MNEDKLKCFMRCGAADLNDETGGGVEILKLACKGGSKEIVQHLIEQGADKNHKSAPPASFDLPPQLLDVFGPDSFVGWIFSNSANASALHHAALFGNLATVMSMLESGANPCLFNGHGRTPASLARGADHVEVAKLLERAEAQQTVEIFV